MWNYEKSIWYENFHFKFFFGTRIELINKIEIDKINLIEFVGFICDCVD
jgi:hypothetical protein